MRPVIFLMLVITILSACNSSLPKSQVLKFNLEKGKTYSYQMHVDTENEAQGKKKSEMNFDYEMEVIDDKDGIKTLKSTYNRVVMTMDARGTKVNIDTDKPVVDSVTDPQTNPVNMMGNMFHAIVGKNFIMKVDAEGKVTDVDGLNEMAEAMLGSMKLNEQMKPMIRRLFSAQFNEENLKQSFSQGFNIFPNKAVKVGDTWDKTITMPGIVSSTIKSTYKVKSITDTQVTLDVNSTIEAGNTKGTQTGNMVVDSKTGLVIEGTLEQNFEGQMNSRIKITGKEK